MPKINIPKSEKTKRLEARAVRVLNAKGKGQPQNSDIMQMLTDIWDELQEIKEKL